MGQQRFKFLVLKRYGPCCAICGIDVPQLLDAAHIVPKEKGGTDDPRNGLVLCALHHRAFDAKFIAIAPADTKVHIMKIGLDRAKLNITRANLKHLVAEPHVDALAMRWKLCADSDTCTAACDPKSGDSLNSTII